MMIFKVYSCYPKIVSIPNLNPARLLHALSANQQKTLLQSWDLIEQAFDKQGQILFYTYFQEHPQNLKYFSFKPKSKETVSIDENIALHGDQTMVYFKDIVSNMSDKEKMNEKINVLADSHVGLNIEDSAFDNLRVTMLALITSKIEENKITAETTLTWDKFLQNLQTDLLAAINVKKKKQSSN